MTRPDTYSHGCHPLLSQLIQSCPLLDEGTTGHQKVNLPVMDEKKKKLDELKPFMLTNLNILIL